MNEGGIREYEGSQAANPSFGQLIARRRPSSGFDEAKGKRREKQRGCFRPRMALRYEGRVRWGSGEASRAAAASKTRPLEISSR